MWSKLQPNPRPGSGQNKKQNWDVEKSRRILEGCEARKREQLEVIFHLLVFSPRSKSGSGRLATAPADNPHSRRSAELAGIWGNGATGKREISGDILRGEPQVLGPGLTPESHTRGRGRLNAEQLMIKELNPDSIWHPRKIPV